MGLWSACAWLQEDVRKVPRTGFAVSGFSLRVLHCFLWLSCALPLQLICCLYVAHSHELALACYWCC